MLVHGQFVHAIAQTFGLSVPGGGKQIEREEYIAEAFAEPLMLLRDNPKVVDWLQS